MDSSSRRWRAWDDVEASPALIFLHHHVKIVCSLIFFWAGRLSNTLFVLGVDDFKLGSVLVEGCIISAILT